MVLLCYVYFLATLKFSMLPNGFDCQERLMVVVVACQEVQPVLCLQDRRLYSSTGTTEDRMDTTAAQHLVIMLTAK